MKARLVVLASGGGTNCQALIDACAAETLHASIAAVVTNNEHAGVLARAAAASIATRRVSHSRLDGRDRAAQDQELIDVIAAFDPDLVVLAGWMRVLGASVGQRFKMINLHPARPGELPGTRAIERAYVEWQQGDRDRSGVMVHWVPDEGVDVGPLIVTEDVHFEPGDTLDSFAARMHATEHRLIVSGTATALGTGHK